MGRVRAGRRTPASGGMLSIGALSRASGIPAETLRAWERRYGYPVPHRKPSGHRLYPLASVPRLRRIAEALARGHRAGEVVPASNDALAALLGTATPRAAAGPPVPRPPADDPTAGLLRAVERFDPASVTRVLAAEWARRGPLPFLVHCVAPLVRAVGDAWEQGRLEVRHEHFLSERVGDLLRTLRLPFEERATGPLVVLCTLPGEAHGLGLQMVALLLATTGCRLCHLGTEVPVPQTAALGRDLAARAVGVSVSEASRGASTTAKLTRLRTLLPRRIELVVGGAGAPAARAGLTVITDLERLEGWARALVAAG